VRRIDPPRGGGDTILGPAHSLTIAEDGTVVLVLADLAGSGVRLAFVDANGDVRGLTAPIPDESRALGGAGSVIWDSVQQRASYLPLGRYTFETYDATGTHVGRRDLGARLNPPAQEQIKRVLQLRNGEFVVQIVGGIRVAQPPYAWKPTARLELLSPTLSAVAMLDGGGPGLLIGADDDGHLYFQNIVRDGGTVIIKTKLNVQQR
jgi:hypothetical protein